MKNILKKEKMMKIKKVSRRKMKKQIFNYSNKFMKIIILSLLFEYNVFVLQNFEFKINKKMINIEGTVLKIMFNQNKIKKMNLKIIFIFINNIINL